MGVIDRGIVVASAPTAGKGLALNRSGQVPVGVAVPSMRVLDADPVAPRDGEFWFRQDTGDLCVTTDGVVSRVGLVADGVDADVAAFLTATSITDATITAAITDLVADLKTAGLWTQMQAIYPFVGGTSATHKFNLKDPRDLDAAFRISWTGALTHASTGVTPDLTGGDSYGDTHYIPSVAATSNNASMSYYSRSNNVGGSQCDYGAYNSPTSDDRFHLIIRYDGDLFYPGIQDVHDANLTGSSDSTGLFANSRISSANIHAYRNGSEFSGSPISNTADVLCDISVYVGRLNGFPLGKSQREVAFATLGLGLSGTDQAALYTAVQAFQTTLGRQV